jgi:Copper transport outer membrane protein, MctB
MISLRQHIFSLVAVFVALAVGIAAGSTVVRGPLLDSTRARLESAEENIAVERAENDQLAAELSQLDGWEDDGPAQLLAGRLAGSAVVVVVAGDVDGDVVEGVVRSLHSSAGILIGEVRLDSAVFDDEQAPRLHEALGTDPAETPDPSVVFGERVGELIASTADEITSTSAVRADQVLNAAFGAYEDAGLVDLLQMTSLEVSVDDVDLLVLTDRNLVADPARVLGGVIAVSDPEIAGMTVMVAEVGRVLQDNDSPVPSFVAAIRESGRLRDEVSTVDNAETILGWIVVVLGLEAARDGHVDHYGFRDGADRSLPPRSSP